MTNHTPTATWSGHEFQVFQQGADWHDVPGVYIFAGADRNNQWAAVYIGKTTSFRERLPDHEQWDGAVRLGATHIHARVVNDQASRDEMEVYLIRVNQPPLNQQHR